MVAQVELKQYQNIFMGILMKYCCLFDGIFGVGWSFQYIGIL